MQSAMTMALRRAANAIDGEQTKRLGGSNTAAPGAYPVPARTGHLHQKTFWDVPRATLAFVGNRATYAHAVHEGLGSNRTHGRRPFLDDAVAAVDWVEPMAIAVRQTLDP